MRRFLLCGIALVMSLTALAVTGTPAGADVRTGATVRVVHAIPGTALAAAEALPVDVEVDGTCAITDLEFGDVVGPIELTGDVDLRISLANATTPCSNAPVISADDVPMPAGESVSIVAHLDVDGAPTASVFSDATAATAPPGLGVATVRHTAAAPAVEVWLGADEAAPSGLTIANTEQVARVELAAGTYQAGLGTSDTLLFGPADLPVNANQVTVVYAVGVFGEDSFQLITDSFPLPATVRVVHGVPGLDVDVEVGGICVLPGFEFASVQVLALEPDTYDIEISPANAMTPCSEAAVITADDVAVTAGQDVSIAAHLDADGNPTASIFANDVGATSPTTRGRLSVRHAAEAPTVQAWLGAPAAAPTGLSISSGEQIAKVDLTPGQYQAGLGDDDMLLFGPADIEIAANEMLVVYAVGTFGTNTFQLIPETISLTPAGSGDGGYALVSDTGAIEAAGTYGVFDGVGVPLNAPVVDAVSTSVDSGAWLAAPDGGVFALGDAGFFGSAGSIPLNSPVVGIDAAPDDQGYWLAAADGGVFAYGSATFFGSQGGQPLNQPVVDIAATASGNGYWLVASDGGVFAYGDATFFGSLGGTTLNSPIVDIAVTPSGNGYWMVAADGGVFAYGDASFHGSGVDNGVTSPVTGLLSTEAGDGYWLTTADGQVLAFGAATVIDGDAPTGTIVDIIG
ncbi:MAG: DUF4397 domain-containing protein [Actinomycetota bacterium]